jgi:hypothetical protein
MLIHCCISLGFFCEMNFFCIVMFLLLFLSSRRVHSPSTRYSKNTMRKGNHIFNNDVICVFYCVFQLLRDQIGLVTVPAAELKLQQSGLLHVKQGFSNSGSQSNP